MRANTNVTRAARNLIIEHGEAAERIALEHAKNAEDGNRKAVASRWRSIAATVRRLQGRPDRQA
jgi:hypothetical protein